MLLEVSQPLLSSLNTPGLDPTALPQLSEAFSGLVDGPAMTVARIAGAILVASVVVSVHCGSITEHGHLPHVFSGKRPETRILDTFFRSFSFPPIFPSSVHTIIVRHFSMYELRPSEAGAQKTLSSSC